MAAPMMSKKRKVLTAKYLWTVLEKHWNSIAVGVKIVGAAGNRKNHLVTAEQVAKQDMSGRKNPQELQ